MTTRPSSTSVEDRLALLRERAREIKPSDPLEPTPMVVAIENIQYDDNPRGSAMRPTIALRDPSGNAASPARCPSPAARARLNTWSPRAETRSCIS